MQVIILGDSGVGKTSLMNQYVCLNPDNIQTCPDLTRSTSLGQQEVFHLIQSHHRRRFPHQGSDGR